MLAAMVQRAKTTLGLLAQLLKVKWAGLGKRGKILLFAALVLGGLTALQLGTCLMGGCPSQQSPCSGAMQSDEPCPYSAGYEAADEAPAQADEDVPPCHAR